MSSLIGMSLIGVVVLATVHVVVGKRELAALERPRWLAVANGLSVAYVVVHLLPELAEVEARWLEAWPDRPFRWLDRQVYLAALLGILLAVGLDRAVLDRTTPGPRFWLRTTSFAVYNLIVGGFALQVARGVELWLGVIAFAAHFIVYDHGLRAQHPVAYARYGRWVLAAAILAGWTVALMTNPSVIVVAVLLGIVSGGIIMSVIKEEIPTTRASRYPLFVVGALAYTLLLLAVEYSAHAA